MIFQTNTVLWYPKTAINTICDQKKQNYLVRYFPQSSIIAFGRWLNQQEWSSTDYTSVCSRKKPHIHQQDLGRYGYFFPLKFVKLHNSDKPWMCSSIKQLTLDRHNAFHRENIPLWKHSNEVKQAIIIQKQSFYSEKVRHLKQSDRCGGNL